MTTFEFLRDKGSTVDVCTLKFVVWFFLFSFFSQANFLHKIKAILAISKNSSEVELGTLVTNNACMLFQFFSSMQINGKKGLSLLALPKTFLIETAGHFVDSGSSSNPAAYCRIVGVEA